MFDKDSFDHRTQFSALEESSPFSIYSSLPSFLLLKFQQCYLQLNRGILHPFNLIIRTWCKLKIFCNCGSEICRKFNAINTLFFSFLGFICHMYKAAFLQQFLIVAEDAIYKAEYITSIVRHTFTFVETSFFKSGKVFSISRRLKFLLALFYNSLMRGLLNESTVRSKLYFYFR